MISAWNYCEAAFLCVICIIALTGNVSLFLIVFRSRSLQKTFNFFTLNLAFADTLVSLISIPVTIYAILNQRWLLGQHACHVLGFINILSFISSVMSLALIAINRFFFVVHWKNYKRYFSPKRVKIFLILNWVLSALLSLPPLAGWSSFGYVPGKSYCFVLWQDNVYFVYFMVIVCFFGPLVTMGFCYTKILLFTKNSKQKIGTVSSLSESTRNSVFRNVSPEETRITNTLLIVLGVFIVCWSPFATTMFFDIYYPYPLPRWIDMGSLLLGYMNSLCNPIIYSVRNRQFRKAFFELYSLCGLPLFKRNANNSRQRHEKDHENSNATRQNNNNVCGEKHMMDDQDIEKMNVSGNNVETHKQENLNGNSTAQMRSTPMVPVVVVT